MKSKDFESEVIITPAQAGTILGVDPKTITRYALAGKLSYTRTPGGHRRYKLSDVYELRDAYSSEAENAQ